MKYQILEYTELGLIDPCSIEGYLNEVSLIVTTS